MTSWWPLSGIPSWHGEGHLMSLLIHGHLKASWALRGASQVALVVKNPPADVGDVRDVGSIPELGRSPGEGNGNPLQYTFLENPMDRGAWWATVHGVAKSQTQLSGLTLSHFHFWMTEVIFFPSGCWHKIHGLGFKI